MKRAILLALMAACTAANAVVYDLKTDWSDTVNPNGVWTYREGLNALPHVASWQSSLGGWSSAQPGWAKSENGSNRLPFIFKSNGTETFTHDFIAGDVVMHSWDGTNGVGSGQGNIAWTSPGVGTVSVTGAVWMGRDIGRAVNWTVEKNGIIYTGGSLFDGDPYNRANPFNLLAGSGGAGIITNVPVLPGDQMVLNTSTSSASGDFVGMNYTLNFTPVPEPATVVALVLGTGLLLLKRRRK